MKEDLGTTAPQSLAVKEINDALGLAELNATLAANVLRYMRERAERDEEIVMDANSAELVLSELRRLGEIKSEMHRRAQQAESREAKLRRQLRMLASQASFAAKLRLPEQPATAQAVAPESDSLAPPKAEA